MRPPSVYAKRSCPAGDPCDLLRLLHGPHRIGLRLVMILLSQQGWTAVTIAELLGCDPRTVRRWVHRYNAHGPNALADRPRSGRPRLGSRRLSARIRRLLAQPKAWTIGLLHLYLGRPAMSLRTLHRRVREVAAWRRPRLVAKGAADAEQVVADLRQAITDLPDGAVVLAEDETHINLLPWVRSTWIVKGARQRVMTPGTNRRRSLFGAVDLRTGRWFYQVTRRAVSATFIQFMEYVLAGYPTAPVVVLVLDNVLIHRSKLVQAWLRAPAHAAAVRRALQPPPQPRRAHLGCTQGRPGQQPDPDHRRAHPPGPRLLPPAHQHPAPGDRRTVQLTLAPRGLRTELQAGRLDGMMETRTPERLHAIDAREVRAAVQHLACLHNPPGERCCRES
jgi:transposase